MNSKKQLLKLLFASISVIIIINSCSTNNSSGGGTTPIPISIFRMNINGQSFEWVGSLFQQVSKGSKIERSRWKDLGSSCGIPPNSTSYTLTAGDESSNNALFMEFYSPSRTLNPGLYSSTTTCDLIQVEFHINQFGWEGTEEFMSVNVSNVSADGYASGTFNGQLHLTSSTANNLPVSGEFINVKYIQ